MQANSRNHIFWVPSLPVLLTTSWTGSYCFFVLAFFLLNLFFKLSNRRLALPRLREKMCALLWYTMYSEPSTINQETCFVILWARSSHQRFSVGKGVLKNFAKFMGQHLCQSLFFNKVAGLRPATFRSSHHRCSVRKGVLRNFTNFTGKDLYQSLFLTKLQPWGLHLY